MTFSAGDRVYYTDNGPSDTGTVEYVDGEGVRVHWDSGDNYDGDLFDADQLTEV
jgi:hypothetical protein